MHLSWCCSFLRVHHLPAIAGPLSSETVASLVHGPETLVLIHTDVFQLLSAASSKIRNGSALAVAKKVISSAIVLNANAIARS